MDQHPTSETPAPRIRRIRALRALNTPAKREAVLSGLSSATRRAVVVDPFSVIASAGGREVEIPF